MLNYSTFFVGILRNLFTIAERLHRIENMNSVTHYSIAKVLFLKLSIKQSICARLGMCPFPDPSGSGYSAQAFTASVLTPFCKYPSELPASPIWR